MLQQHTEAQALNCSLSMDSIVERMLPLYGDAKGAIATVDPMLLILVSVAAGALLPILFGFLFSVWDSIQEKGFRSYALASFFEVCKRIPGFTNYVEKEQGKVLEKLASAAHAQRECWLKELPEAGVGESVLEKLKLEKSRDKAWQGKSSGAVYIKGNEYGEHFSLINAAYSLFAHTNPLHPDLFPSVSRFEAEVVAMVATMLGSKANGSGGEICGNMTSGGTESILMAVKTARDYMRASKGITKPEMIIPDSAHSAYDKAAKYFNIRLRRAPLDGDLKADVKSIGRMIGRNTIMIIGSAPGFPHGIIDDIEELGALAIRHGICFHVDLCLGGFVLPFAKMLGYPIPPFDFRVPGVTSISVDVHKYGLGPKGTSVVLYRNHQMRRHQFVAVTEWPGGLYISPSMAGSRAGGLIAGAWAAMVSLGKDGYLDAVAKIMKASEEIKNGINAIPGLYVLGKPLMTVIAFGSDSLDIFKINDAMSSKGWSLNALQKPNSVHICVTLQHIDMAETFLQDLGDSVSEVRENPSGYVDGMAPIYGAASSMTFRGALEDLLVAYMDTTC